MTLVPSTGHSPSRIARARAFAKELIDRLVRNAAPGFHVVAGSTRRGRDTPHAHAGLVIVRPRNPDPRRPQAKVSPPPGRDAFTTLLAQGRLTNDPVALLMRSCNNDRHHAAGHQCVMRGWVSRDGLARPMQAAAVRSATAALTLVADPDGITGPGAGRALPPGSLIRPHPFLPPHPSGPVRYETAYPLRPFDPDLP